MIELLLSTLIGASTMIITVCVMSCVIIAGESDKRFEKYHIK